MALGRAWIILSLLSCASWTWARRPPLVPGLIATYASASGRIFTIVPAPAFGLADGESVHPQVAADFTASYEGFVRVEDAGEYTFSQRGHIMLDGQEVAGKRVKLTEGDHLLQIEVERGDGRFQLVWQLDGRPPEPLPSRLLGHAQGPPSLVEALNAERGRFLVEELNCTACHADPGLPGRRGPDLSHVGSRVKGKWIEKWLQNPRHFRPTAVMPFLARRQANRTDIATFLMTLKDPPSAAAASDTSGDADRGKALYESIGCLACHGKSGHSLDGVGSKYTQESLTRYLHDPLAVDLGGRMPDMLLSAGQAADIAACLMRSKNPDFEGELTGGDPGRGRVWVQVHGCLNCHTITLPDGKPLAKIAAISHAELAKADPDKGCLGDDPQNPIPVYALTRDQKDEIRAFLKSHREQPDMAPAPVFAYRLNARRFGCTNCHALDELKPLPMLASTPALTFAGEKLRKAWIEDVLTGRQRVRPWLVQRMPHYGSAVGAMGHEIVAVSGAGPVAAVTPPSVQIVNLGCQLVGVAAKPDDKAFSCVTCHSYRDSAVAVVPESRGPELTLMSQRIRPDFFQRWVYNPAHIQPATPMPTFFIDQSYDQARPTIQALWGYLSLGDRMPPPALK